MVFSSNFFIYVFFPLFLLFYFTAVKTFPKSTKAANAIILLFSLTFYLFTGGFFVLLLLAVIIWNYILALAIEKYRKKLLLIVTVGGIFCCFYILNMRYSYMKMYWVCCDFSHNRFRL